MKPPNHPIRLRLRLHRLLRSMSTGRSTGLTLFILIFMASLIPFVHFIYTTFPPTPLNAQNTVLRDLSCTAGSGSGTAYTCNFSSTPSGYVNGGLYSFKSDVANTGVATINFSSMGAKTIVKVSSGVTTALVANDIRAGQWVQLKYDGTNMQMLSQLGNAGSGGGSSGGTVDLPVGGCNHGLGGTAYYTDWYVGYLVPAPSCNAFWNGFTFQQSSTPRITRAFTFPASWSMATPTYLKIRGFQGDDTSPSGLTIALSAAISCTPTINYDGATYNTASTLTLIEGAQYATSDSTFSALDLTGCTAGGFALVQFKRTGGTYTLNYNILNIALVQ